MATNVAAFFMSRGKAEGKENAEATAPATADSLGGPAPKGFYQLYVKQCMEMEGITLKALSAKSGLAKNTLANFFSGGRFSTLTLQKCESAFDFRYSFVSDAATLAARKRCVERLGFDAALLGRDLYKRARALGLPGNKPADETIKLLLAKAAVAPVPKTKTSPTP